MNKKMISIKTNILASVIRNLVPLFYISRLRVILATEEYVDVTPEFTVSLFEHKSL